MISELARETLPLWETQPLPVGLRTQTPLRPFVVARKAPLTVARPIMRPPVAGRYIPVLLALFVVLNGADLLSTFVGLQNGLHEGNPLMSALLVHYGFVGLIAYKTLVVLAVGTGVLLLRSFQLKVAHATIWVCNLLVLGVVLLNVLQYTMVS